MKGSEELCLAAICVVIICLAAWAYHEGWFTPAPNKNHFVGAYGRTPGMQNCIATGPDGKSSYFNRCTWV
jgi:hypothetical protein